MLEKLIHFSLTQRFVVCLGALVLIGAGALSWRELNLDAVPDITSNQVVVNTETGGLGPEEVEKLVTFPIESAMGGIPNVEHVRSLSQFGLSQVTVTFRDDVNIYFARQLVSERLGIAASQLPEGVEKPQMGPVSTGLGDIYMYSLESDERSPMDLRSIQDWVIAPQLRTVAGVAEVNAADGSVKEYQIVVDPHALVARGIGVDEVVAAIQRNNQNVGGGVIERNSERMLVRSVGQASNVADLERVVIKSEDGIPVLVRDVAEVRLGVPTLTGISSKDGKETLVAIVMMLKGANGRDVARAVDHKIREIREQLPPDVRLTTTYDRSHLVDDVLGTVRTSLLEGAALVVVVLVLVLGNVRGAVVVAVAIPLAMLAAVTGMNHFGISGNLMSLGAIDFGLIVDGAVVMVENAVRRVSQAREHAKRTLTRAEVRHTVWEATREVAKPTAFAVTIITVVYLPILALEGIEGKMFKPMAFTVVFALLSALALTLTLVPVLTSLVLSGDTREPKNPLMAVLNRCYAPTLALALRRRAWVIGGSLLLLTLAGVIYPRLGAEFVPQLDEGSLVIQPVRVRTVDAEQTIRLVTAFEKKILEVPEVTTVFSRSGTPELATDPMPLSLTDSYIMLKPRKEWRPGLTKEMLVEELADKANEVPGQGYNFTQPIQMRFSELASGVKADVGIKIFGEDLVALKSKADEIAALIRELPGAQDVEVEQVDQVPLLQIVIDRDAIARHGIAIADVQNVIATTLGGASVSQIIEGDRRFNLTVLMPDSIRNDVEAIKRIPIETASGESVPLNSLASVEEATAPAQISREMGRRRVVVQFNVRGTDLASFVALAQQEIRAKTRLKEGMSLTWGGQFENLQHASTRLTLVVPLALSFTFILLFWTFGSVKHALVIFTGVPLAVTGGVLALALRGMPFSISAGVGFIALSGVAVMNGVVMLSAINRWREEGFNVGEAIVKGAAERLRPVLMTALVAALGFVPMALNTGLGAEVQRPLATVVIGGIVSATMLTLLVLPALVSLCERDQPAEDRL